MQDFGAILHNQVLLVALLACFAAQGLKLVIDVLKNGKVNLRILLSSGGMPSSHSSLVSALATSIGQSRGWDSVEFAIACLFAVIVMYDAAGVRLAASQHARLLNQIIDELYAGKDFNEERLKELLGHTPIQVLVGLALGVSISLLATSQLS